MPKEQISILIVDDKEENLLLLERILVNHGYRVMKASSGEQALPLARESQPDVILLDVRMPGMDGYEVCRRLKIQHQTVEIPVIFVSAQNEVGDKLVGFEAGGVEYISKPFDVDETIARIQTHVTLRQMQKQLQQVNNELLERLKELSASQQQLHNQETKLGAIINAMPNLTFVYDENGQYLEIMGNETNHLFTRAREMLGKRIEDLLPPIAAGLLMEAIRAVLKTGENKVIEYQLPVISGEMLWFEGRISLLERDSSGRGRVVFVATEITERVELYQKIHDLAIRDPLTDCYNRRHFLSLAAREVQRAARYGRSLSLLLLDLDHFKQVNDSHGHLVGDQVLRLVVEKCQKSIRNIDILGRFGGEEFTFLMPETGMDDALRVAERLRQVVESMEIPFARGSLSITASIGVACLQALDGSNRSLEDFIDAADKALYAAKADGRNCIRSYCQPVPANSLT